MDDVGLEVHRDQLGGGKPWVIIDSKEALDQIAHCTSFAGTLVFTGPDLASLEGLSLLAVDGDLRIDAEGLQSLAGLESLTAVTQDLRIGNAAPSFTDLSGLSGLRYVGWRFSILGHPYLSSLQGLDARVNLGQLSLGDCPELSDLSAISGSCVSNLSLARLPRLGSLAELPVQADMSVLNLVSLPSLVSLDGLEDLRRVGTRLSLIDLPALEEMRALGGLLAAHELVIDNVPAMIDFSAFEALEYIGFALELDGEGPTSLHGLSHLTYLGHLTLGDTHPGIADYEGVDSLRELRLLNMADGIAIEGLESVEYIASFHADSSVSFDHMVELERLGELSLAGPSPLPTMPPNLKYIGRLKVSGTSSQDLAVFDSVARIDELALADVPQFESLAGFHHGGKLEGELRFFKCPNLDLSALEDITSVAQLVVTDSQISSLAPLEGLTNLDALVIERTQLSDLDALSNLEKVRRHIAITENPQLRSIAGLSQLSAFDPEVREPQLVIENNPALPQCQANELYERLGFTPAASGNNESATCP